MGTSLAELARRARARLGHVVVGHEEPLEILFLTLICGGHVLLEGVPGLGKTLAVRTLARILGVRYRRVQSTPDLMPADITGSSVLNMATSEYRMPPRTQAALLEAMEERQVTIDGEARALSPLFTVVATQNPVEFEGTYPLPEAELDRFAVKLKLDYPEAAQEEAILLRHHGRVDDRLDEGTAEAPIGADEITAARREAAAVRVDPALLTYIAAVGRRTREWPSVALGASPRAAIHLMQLAKAYAALDGRDFVLPDDVKRMAPAVLRHRLVLQAESSLEGLTADQIVGDVLAAVPVPK
jgi:MoxR-like ATPase